MMRVIADNLNRVMNCNGSHVMPASHPAEAGDDDPTARDEGTAAHYMALAAFRGEYTVAELIDRKAPNGFYMTAEMSDHVSAYLASLNCGTMETDTSYGGDNWYVAGRCDHERYDATTDTQEIDDFKYGWGLVEPENNWTLASHAIGLSIKRGAWPTWAVLRIHQPRPHHPDGKVREWRISGTELYALYQRIATTLANPSDTLHTGQSWCRGCHALATCPAAREAHYNAFDTTTRVYSDALSDTALAYELDSAEYAAATIKARLDALKELAKFRITGGAVLSPNTTHAYQLKATYGHRKWHKHVTPEIVFALTGKSVATQPGLITPAAAERAGVNEGIIEALTERPNTGVKLIRVNIDAEARRILGAK